MAASIRLQRVAKLGNLILQNEIRFLHHEAARRCVSKQRICGSALEACVSATSQLRLYSTKTETASGESMGESTDDHRVIKETEKVTGSSDRHEFQAETRMLLDIVAKSLYSDKEVFIRELVSNASDALEKRRYRSLSAGVEEAEDPYEIHITTDKLARTISIQDTGLGMTKEELIANLGTIARSGSKAFLEQVKEKGSEASNIIGQFGVGFYSVFMVAEKVEVYTRSFEPGSPGLQWTSDGSGTYEIKEAEGVQHGTKVVAYLKTECREFGDEEIVNNIIKKYSNFVGSPIYVNGKQVNTIQPLWLMDPKEITPQMHDEFYRFVGNAYDRPRFILHYKTDAPLSVRALIYFPEGKPDSAAGYPVMKININPL